MQWFLSSRLDLGLQWWPCHEEHPADRQAVLHLAVPWPSFVPLQRELLLLLAASVSSPILPPVEPSRPDDVRGLESGPAMTGTEEGFGAQTSAAAGRCTKRAARKCTTNDGKIAARFAILLVSGHVKFHYVSHTHLYLASAPL